MHDDVRRVEVSTTYAAAVATPSVAVPGHRHLDDVGRKSRQRMPPRRRETGGHGLLAVAPYGCPDARGVGEGSVVDEVDTASASTPAARPQPSPNGFVAQAGISGLSEGDDAVLASQIVIQHP
ncbi:MAG: hypothetical protein QOD36_1936 [Mycobacterium sp.]|nr:hypothetical protein [Mycobacterium sp.]MDT5331829.1 hypothetical protein [Mycobacterium sp.]